MTKVSGHSTALGRMWTVFWFPKKKVEKHKQHLEVVTPGSPQVSIQARMTIHYICHSN